MYIVQWADDEWHQANAVLNKVGKCKATSKNGRVTGGDCGHLISGDHMTKNIY